MRSPLDASEFDPALRSRTEPLPGTPISASSALLDLMPRMPEQAVTFGWLVSALGDRSIGLVLVLLGLVATLPGVSAFAGVLIAGPACQLLFGGGATGLPKFLADRPIGRGKLLPAFRVAIPSLRYFERLSRPRFWLFKGLAERAVGAAILLMDIFLFLPIPFTNIAPAVMIALLALAYLQDDGILLGVSLTGTLIMLTFAPVLMWQAAQLAL